MPANPAYRNLKAVALCHTGDYETAIDIYDELTRAYPAQAPIWMSLGHASKTAGQTERAIAAYRKCIELDARLRRGVLEPGQPQDLPLRRGASATRCATRSRARTSSRNIALCIEFALGKALEDRAEYAESFEHYANGNTLRLAQIPYSANDTSARLRARARNLHARNSSAQRAGSGFAAPDPIFIVGLPRAGSTLIEQILASHSAVEGTMELPDITSITRSLRRAAADKHPGAYHDALARMSADELRALGEQYLERTRIQRKLGRPFFIDKMPNNFAHVGLIHLVLPNAKIIDARRHPLACCFSVLQAALRPRPEFHLRPRERRPLLPRLRRADGALRRGAAGPRPSRDLRGPGRGHRSARCAACSTTAACRSRTRCLRFFENERPVRTASSEQVRQPIFRAASITGGTSSRGSNR